MSVRVNVRMSKIMRTPIKVGVSTYATYTNCRTLNEDIINPFPKTYVDRIYRHMLSHHRVYTMFPLPIDHSLECCLELDWKSNEQNISNC